MATKAKIVQFRRGLKRIHEKHYIIDVNVDSREKAAKFVGKELVWTSSSGKEIKGKISAPHGNKGMVRAIFEKGLPGQSRNEYVEMSDLKSETKKIENDLKSRGK